MTADTVIEIPALSPASFLLIYCPASAAHATLRDFGLVVLYSRWAATKPDFFFWDAPPPLKTPVFWRKPGLTATLGQRDKNCGRHYI
jgi:hypothetical protein